MANSNICIVEADLWATCDSAVFLFFNLLILFYCG